MVLGLEFESKVELQGFVNVKYQKNLWKDKEIWEKSLLFYWRANLAILEQHLKNKKINNPHFTDPNNVVKLIQLNI